VEFETKSDNNYKEMSPLKDTSDVDVEYTVKDESFVIRRSLNAQINEDDLMQQRENIFHMRCYINSKVYDMIIDGMSCTNVANTTLIKKLNLNTTKHLRLYKF
jgi:hypothetical protein